MSSGPALGKAERLDPPAPGPQRDLTDPESCELDSQGQVGCGQLQRHQWMALKNLCLIVTQGQVAAPVYSHCTIPWDLEVFFKH